VRGFIPRHDLGGTEEVSRAGVHEEAQSQISEESVLKVG
jgi:hypothetical protein